MRLLLLLLVILKFSPATLENNSTKFSSSKYHQEQLWLLQVPVTPNGWLRADGSGAHREKYPDLFNVIGDFYGSRDDAGIFNLPDLRGRVLVGTGKGIGLTHRKLGNDFGSEQHILTQSEMPTHVHPLDDPGHSHDMGSPTRGQIWGITVGSQQACYGVTNGGVTNNPPTLQSQTGIKMRSVGDGAPNNNMQPSIAMNYIIKY
ncbi:unnamed protein product [Rotaria socialis]|uniref:Phage tail collar domain-containing protein n=2 Tax=Rotaria socialis TaxID=392032 RepID=A0A819Z9G2_9BILA|nr:unnamed protein product [Rotaria socialis]CAF4170542.1 unnamed protein product [Rotaria socialis]